MAKLDWVAVKAWDGAGFGDATDPRIFADQFAASVGPIKAAGLRCLAWGYLYGADPLGEAGALVQACSGADGIILDAEYEYVGRAAAAARFFAVLAEDRPLAVTTDFRLLVGNGPPTKWTAAGLDLDREPWPWATFLARCSAVMPQLYHTDFAVSPATVDQLNDVYNAACAWKDCPRRPNYPIYPHDATFGDLDRDLANADRRGLGGWSIWLMDDTAPPFWKTLGDAK